jgi:predicted dehydrogenase
MPDRKFGIVIDGATGRLGTTQHLRALLDIRREDGLVLSNGDRLLPEPILLGRDSRKLAALAEKYGELRWSTDRDACLADPAVDIYFDATATGGRPERARAAFAARKHVYLEKPVAETLEDALSLARAAEQAGKKGGVVQDKLFLPGLKSCASFTKPISSVACYRSGSISAGGCSTASCSRRSGRAGTTGRRPAAG